MHGVLLVCRFSLSSHKESGFNHVMSVILQMLLNTYIYPQLDQVCQLHSLKVATGEKEP